jgi:hypothetical protein
MHQMGSADGRLPKTEGADGFVAARTCQNPHVFGHAVGRSPLVVLVTVTAIGLLFGGVYVLLSVPLASFLATLLDVIVLNRDPERQNVPAVFFPAKDAEA